MIGETTMQTADAGDNTAVNAAYNHLPIVNRLYFDADAHPADGSAFAKAKEDADLYVPHSLAGILFQAAKDHLLLALGTFPAMPIPRYALYTAIRGAIEAAAGHVSRLRASRNASSTSAIRSTDSAVGRLKAIQLGNATRAD